jgi:hypothetical protein
VDQSKLHHYLPQRYLSGFAGPDEKIWVFDRRTGKLRRDSPKSTGAETYLYRFEDQAGEPKSLEPYFSFLENKAWPAIDHVDSGADPTAEDRTVLAFYTAFQFTRTPRFGHGIRSSMSAGIRELVSGLSDDEAVVAILDSMRESGMTELSDPAVLKQWMPQFRAGYQMPDWGVARLRMSTAQTIADVLMKMTTQIVYAGDDAFITTESPVLFVAPPWATEPSLVTPGALKIVPLTKRTLLIFTDFGDRIEFYEPKRERTDFMNATIASEAEHLIIGPTQELVRDMADPATLRRILPD